MITKKIKKNYICINKSIFEKNNKIEKFLEKNLEKFEKIIKEPFILVLWWDGTMLKAIRKNYKKNIAFFWINFWNTWFLLNKKENIKNISDYKIIKYPLLEVNYKIKDKFFSSVCFNEVNITVSDWKVLELDLNIWEKKVNLKWDWVLIATPAGSTAYNKSLYWPIVPHNKKVFIMTPKAEISHKKPIIFKNDEKILIKNINRLNSFKIYLDWNILWKKIINTPIKINVFKSKTKVKLINI